MKVSEMNDNVLVIGASGTIAKAITRALLKEAKFQKIILISRSYQKDFSDVPAIEQLQSDYSTDNIMKIGAALREKSLSFSKIFICNGLLHSDTIKPEKRLEDFNPDAFVELLIANTLTPFNWLKSLLPVLQGTHKEVKAGRCQVVVFSARVGSISDNSLGGWYSYRASKAALNMLLKTAAIEFKRRVPQADIIAFHPGTTDSHLSKPFQRNVQPEKLFEADWVAQRLLDILADYSPQEQPQFIDYKMEPIPW